MKYLVFGIVIIVFSSCQKKLISYSKTRNVVETYSYLNDSTLQLSGVSLDTEFGFNEKKPIMLGIVDVHKGAENIKKYLNALKGLNGEEIKYKRIKPCCPFETKNFTYEVAPLGLEFDHKHGMLEKYSVEYNNTTGSYTVVLFFNLYDETKKLLAPYGFTYRGN